MKDLKRFTYYVKLIDNWRKTYQFHTKSKSFKSLMWKNKTLEVEKEEEL
jgi:hypothetical protein